MNSRTQRILILAAALFGGLVVVTLILKAAKGGGDDGKQPDADKKASLTALKPGPKRDPGASEPPPPATPPVEVTPRTLVTGKTMLGITPEQVEVALDRAARSADSLIAAQAILGDHRYLREAAENNPDDPKVQFWILAEKVFPAERAQWLEKFKSSDPDNSLPNFLAAQEAFRAMDYAAGIAELRAAAAKEYRDYSDGLRGEVGQLYESTGLFDAQSVHYASARAAATPHVEFVQALSQRVIEQYQQLHAAGEDEAARELEQLGLGMLETVAGHGGADTISSRTMMLFMQENLVRAAEDPDGRLEALSAERERVAELGEQVRTIFNRDDLVDDAQLAGYAFSLHDLGEVAAAEWLVEQIGELPEPDN